MGWEPEQKAKNDNDSVNKELEAKEGDTSVETELDDGRITHSSASHLSESVQPDETPEHLLNETRYPAK